MLGVNPPVLPRSSRFLKRAMDLVGSAMLLLLTAPLLAVIGLAIKLDSRGPMFFRQERIGRGGRRFRLVKFRTMAADAEERREALLAHSKDPDWLLLDDDPRVTRVGRFLRLSSLDELPQLWNVLKGEMSLVGPRPIIASEDRQLDGWRRSRLDLTPGVTGPLAGARADEHPVRGDGEARLPVRDQLVAVDRHPADHAHAARGPAETGGKLEVDRQGTILFGKGTLAIRIAEWFLESPGHELVAVVPVVPEPEWMDSLAEWATGTDVSCVSSGDWRDLSRRRTGYPPTWGSRSSTTEFFPPT